MAAHAVGDGVQSQRAVDAQRVLVGGAHRAGVGVADGAHAHRAGVRRPGRARRSRARDYRRGAPATTRRPEIAGVYSGTVISAPLQPVLARASALLERGRGSAAAELLEPLLQSRGIKRQDELDHPRRAGRGVPDAGRTGPRRHGARPAARSDPRSAADGAAGHAVAAARPGRARPRRAVAGDRAARPRAEVRRGRPRLARHRAGPLRAGLLLPQGRRSRDRPRAPDRGGRGAARRRRSSGTWPRCIRCRA